MIIKEDYLITINSKNKIQRIKMQIEQDPISKVLTIHRITGQFGGKEVLQPDLVITEGKVTRTASEQAILQYNALVKNYLDKGYKKLSNLTERGYETLSEADLRDLLGGDVVSDQSGIPKPMLAKSADQCTSSIWDKEWFISAKLDGTRCLMYYKDGEIHTASRGGSTYDPATTHLRNNEQLRALFISNPTLIIDGELYKHDSEWPLQRISGVARLKEWEPVCENLEYWVYDFVDTKMPFMERRDILYKMRECLKGTPIKIIDHVLIKGYLNIKEAHDDYVRKGFEGLVARNPYKEYGVNKRSAIYMIKVKERQDDEFKVIGINSGLRPEDMSFLLETKEGKTFSAKPIGSAETRIYYLEHPDEFIGKKATCTYFTLSKDGIPTQPVMKHLRPDDE